MRRGAVVRLPAVVEVELAALRDVQRAAREGAERDREARALPGGGENRRGVPILFSSVHSIRQVAGPVSSPRSVAFPRGEARGQEWANWESYAHGRCRAASCVEPYDQEVTRSKDHEVMNTTILRRACAENQFDFTDGRIDDLSSPSTLVPDGTRVAVQKGGPSRNTSSRDRTWLPESVCSRIRQFRFTCETQRGGGA